MAAAVAWSFPSTMSLGILASATAVLPLPLIMFMAAGFLSEHMLPETETMTAPVSFSRSLQTASDAMVAMFMPMASPVSKRNLRWRLLPFGYLSMR